LILGFAFKENCADTRNTKVVDVVQRLEDAGLKVVVFDPLIDEVNNQEYPSIQFIRSLPIEIDALVLAVPHRMFESLDYTKYKNKGVLIVDVKGIMSREDSILRI
jgi:UDP-N-acetyl-D-glucosamine/UDP-N-acetyl-D-galactosamine dehydrogenase